MEPIKNEKAREALDTMCHRCVNFFVCAGTGCEPKKTLMNVVEESELVDAYLEVWDMAVQELETKE